MDERCKRCGAKCCTYFCFQIDEPDDFNEFDDLRWYLCHEGVSIHIEDGDWYISIANRCKMLTEDNLCRIYEERPIICRTYSPDNCDATPGGYDYEEEFTTPEQLEEYAKRVLGAEAYERAKRRARAKADRKARAPARKKTGGKTRRKKLIEKSTAGPSRSAGAVR